MSKPLYFISKQVLLGVTFFSYCAGCLFLHILNLWIYGTRKSKISGVYRLLSDVCCFFCTFRLLSTLICERVFQTTEATKRRPLFDFQNIFITVFKKFSILENIAYICVSSRKCTFLPVIAPFALKFV